MNFIDEHGEWLGVVTPKIGHCYKIRFENGVDFQARFLGVLTSAGLNRVEWKVAEGVVNSSVVGSSRVPFIVSEL